MVLRRVLSILLLFLYIIPSIGVSGSVHYCGGEIAAIVIIPTSEHPCACGPDEPMDNGCCQDENFSFKIKDNHKSADVQIVVNDIFDGLVFLSSTNNYTLINNCFGTITEVYLLSDTEPPDDKLFVLYESYII